PSFAPTTVDADPSPRPAISRFTRKAEDKTGLSTLQANALTAGLPPSTLPPASIPDHTLVQCVGQGAYGEIWLARNVIGTHHAVKIIRRSSFKGVDPFEREFRGVQKFMPISRMHPGLVQILHAGRNDTAGLIYYIMEVADDE